MNSTLEYYSSQLTANENIDVEAETKVQRCIDERKEGKGMQVEGRRLNLLVSRKGFLITGVLFS